MPLNPSKNRNILVEDKLIENLHQQGWWVGKNYFDLPVIEQLAAEAQALYQTKKMTVAGIGRGRDFQQNPEIRQDFIHWLKGESEVQCLYLTLMETLRQTLNRELFLGLFELEAHYAIYPPGAFYKKHFDSFQGAANRIVSVVTYLNFNWPNDGGGELLIYPANSSTDMIHSVRPEAGTLAVFLSEEIAHEVRISHYQRASIAGWFRLNNTH